MVLIKCCDISNEVRPTEVAEPWVDCLLEEYFMQVAVTQLDSEASRRSPLPRFCCLPERQGEVRGSPSGAIHGQRQSHKAHRSDRIHQVRPHPHV